MSLPTSPPSSPRRIFNSLKSCVPCGGSQADSDLLGASNSNQQRPQSEGFGAWDTSDVPTGVQEQLSHPQPPSTAPGESANDTAEPVELSSLSPRSNTPRSNTSTGRYSLFPPTTSRVPAELVRRPRRSGPVRTPSPKPAPTPVQNTEYGKRMRMLGQSQNSNQHGLEEGEVNGRGSVESGPLGLEGAFMTK